MIMCVVYSGHRGWFPTSLGRNVTLLGLVTVRPFELHEQHLASTVAQALDATQLAVTGFPASGFPLARAVLRPS